MLVPCDTAAGTGSECQAGPLPGLKLQPVLQKGLQMRWGGRGFLSGAGGPLRWCCAWPLNKSSGAAGGPPSRGAGPAWRLCLGAPQLTASLPDTPAGPGRPSPSSERKPRWPCWSSTPAARRTGLRGLLDGQREGQRRGAVQQGDCGPCMFRQFRVSFQYSTETKNHGPGALETDSGHLTPAPAAGPQLRLRLGSGFPADLTPRLCRYGRSSG